MTFLDKGDSGEKGYSISEVRMGHLQVVDEEGTYVAGTFLLGNSETVGHRGI